MTKDVQQQAAEIARKAYMVKSGQVSLQRRSRIPATLEHIFSGQSGEERGSTWADGLYVNNHIAVLHDVVRKISGYSIGAIIVDNQFTITVGNESFTGDTHLQAIMKAILHFLPQEPVIGERSDFDLEVRLNELGILE